jgi:hypothetical protein
VAVAVAPHRDRSDDAVHHAHRVNDKEPLADMVDQKRGDAQVQSAAMTSPFTPDQSCRELGIELDGGITRPG